MQVVFNFAGLLIQGTICSLAAVSLAVMLFVSVDDIMGKYIIGSLFGFFFYLGAMGLWMHFESQKKGLRPLHHLTRRACCYKNPQRIHLCFRDTYVFDRIGHV